MTTEVAAALFGAGVGSLITIAGQLAITLRESQTRKTRAVKVVLAQAQTLLDELRRLRRSLQNGREPGTAVQVVGVALEGSAFRSVASPDWLALVVDRKDILLPAARAHRSLEVAKTLSLSQAARAARTSLPDDELHKMDIKQMKAVDRAIETLAEVEEILRCYLAEVSPMELG